MLAACAPGYMTHLEDDRSERIAAISPLKIA